MSGFDPSWLALREPYDHAARAAPPLRLVQAWTAAHGPLRIVDLGSGTGSTLRALAPVLGERQDWTLVELDPALIEAGSAGPTRDGVESRYRKADLATELEEVVAPGTDLVTGSALIDLVGSAWLARLVAAVRHRRAALLMALSYDGRLAWTPEDPDDATAKSLFDRHQRRDKGLGPALGPLAAGSLERALATLPGTTRSAASDWVFGPGDRAIQEALVAGMSDAAIDIDPSCAAAIAGWRRRRLDLTEQGRSHLRLGHRDVAYVPPDGSIVA